MQPKPEGRELDHLQNQKRTEIKEVIMDQNIRAKAQVSTFYYFLIIMVLTTISQLTTMAIIIFGDISDKELLVAATVFVSGFMGAFGIVRIMTNMKLLISEMDKATASTNYGKEMQAIPLSLLRFVFAGLFAAVAIIQLVTIYS